MDSKSKEQLDSILKKEPAATTAGDRAFLSARRSYLTAAQVELYLGAPAKASPPQPLEDLSDKDLAKLAKTLDLDPKEFDGREDLEKAVRAKQAASE